jgi:hypothetical protein
MPISTIGSAGLNQAADVTLCTTSGSVGIGTSSPDSSNKLQVAGDIATSWATNKFIGMKFGAGASYKMGLMLNDSTRECKVWSQSSDSDDKITFYTGPTPSERMRITSDGKLGVNTGGAAYGGTVFRLGVNDTNYCIAVNATAGGTTDMIDFYSSGTFAGKVSSSGATTAYNTSSDYRLKEDITPLTGALTKVSALKPVTFKWKLDGNLGEGFIAHELAEVCPYAVNGEKDEVDSEGNIRAQSIDTSFLVATLTAAIQEQQALITQLQADVAELKGRV